MLTQDRTRLYCLMCGETLDDDTSDVTLTFGRLDRGSFGGASGYRSDGLPRVVDGYISDFNGNRHTVPGGANDD